MKQKTRHYFLILTISIGVLLLTACGFGMTEEEIENMKIEQTVGRYLDGFAMNDAGMILGTVDLDDSKKDDVKAVLEQFLQVLHRENYTMRFVYEIIDSNIMDDTAEIKLSAVLRIYEKENELFSIRLFKDKSLLLVKGQDGEWKIDFKQFIPQELLKVDLLF